LAGNTPLKAGGYGSSPSKGSAMGKQSQQSRPAPAQYQEFEA